MINITQKAEQHFKDLLDQENTPGTQLRISVHAPKTPHADIGLSFCPKGDEKRSDLKVETQSFVLFVAADSADALVDAKIDFIEDQMGGQLEIKAPNLKGEAPKDSAPFKEQLQYVLEAEINPGLASHGGHVNLVDIEDSPEGKVVVLKMGGGCQGCGMANMTLTQGIERQLKAKFSEIVAVKDATDHSAGENPYYKS